MMPPPSRRQMLAGAGLGLLGAAMGPRQGRADPDWSHDPTRWVEADPEVKGERLRIWTTETGAERLAVIRYLLDVQAALVDQPPPVFQPVDEHDLPGRMRLAHDPANRIPVPHIINTGADNLLALHAEGLIGDDSGHVVDSLGSDTFARGAIAALRTHEGKMAGVPFHGWPQILWVRRDWLETWSIAPPESVDDLIRVVRILHDPDRNQRGIILGNTGDYYTQQCFMMVARAYGGNVFGPDGVPTLQSHAILEGLRAYAELARHAGPGRLTWRARDYYIQGWAGCLLYSTFLMDDLAVADVAADSLTGYHFPELPGASFDPMLVQNTAAIATLDGPAGIATGAFSSISGLGLTGYGGDAERLAARSLALFLFRRDAYIAWLHMAPGGMLPVVEGTLADEAFMRDRLGVFRAFGWGAVRRFARSLGIPSSFSVTGQGEDAHANPAAGRVYADGLIGRMVMRVLSGAQSPRAAAAQAQAEALALLD